MASPAPASRSGNNFNSTEEVVADYGTTTHERPRMIKLTFDTNVLRDYLEPSREHHEHVKALVQLDEGNICEIRVVSRFTADVPDGDLRDRLDQLSICQRPRIPTVAQWNVSEWDADFWANDEDEETYLKLFHLIFPGAEADNRKQNNRIADVGHLLGHMHSKRDIFVTRDGAVLNQAKPLLSEFGILVMRPDEALKHCIAVQNG
jgi:hypothetical protein